MGCSAQPCTRHYFRGWIFQSWINQGTETCMANCPFSQCVDQELLKNVKGNKNIIKKSSPWIVIPQYAEVPLNIEAKQIISYFFSVLFC